MNLLKSYWPLLWEHSKDIPSTKIKTLETILRNNYAVLESVEFNDLYALLGVIGIFAKNLKHVLSQELLENKSTNG